MGFFGTYLYDAGHWTETEPGRWTETDPGITDVGAGASGTGGSPPTPAATTHRNHTGC
jgi:hypothetical protein